MKTIYTLIALLLLTSNIHSQWVINGNNVVLKDSTKNVGIGTSSPENKLVVNNGNIEIIKGALIMTGIGTSSTKIRLRPTLATEDNWITSYDQIGNRLWVLNLADRSIANRFGLFSDRTQTYVFNITTDGNVGIKTNASASYALSVSGSIRAKEVLVQTGWSDYVFAKNYKLLSLNEVENYIIKNKHLPDVPSANEVENNGIQLGQMDSILIKKIEELTLYVIDQNKQIQQLQQKIMQLEKDADKKK